MAGFTKRLRQIIYQTLVPRQEILLLILFLVTGIIFRLWDFWKLSFGGDEAGHMIKAVRVARGLIDFFKFNNISVSLNNIILPILQHNHPPLEFLVLIPSVPLQPREFWARLIYILISIFTMTIGYLVLKQISNRKTGLFFLGLFATSPYLIFFARRIDFHMNITAGVLIGLSVLYYFYKKSEVSLYILSLAFALGFWVSVDYLFFIPGYLLILYNSKKNITKKAILKALLIFLIAASLFYAPYIFYSLQDSSPRNAGFNYYLSRYFTKQNSKVATFSLLNILNPLITSWNYFLKIPGVFTIWPVSMLTLLLYKKKQFIRYFLLIILIVIFLETQFITCCTNYLNIIGLLIILAAYWLSFQKKVGWILFLFLIFVNIITSSQILNGRFSPFLSYKIQTDNIIQVGKIAKTCLSGDETYISTDDAWRTQYYFGRNMLPDLESEQISDDKAIELFLDGKLPYSIALVHINNIKLVNKTNLDKLKSSSKRYINIEDDVIYLFKQCEF